MDFGVAFDGDADRVFRSRGRFVDGDGAMVLANYLHARGELSGDVVVGTVMAMWAEIALCSRGLAWCAQDVGDKYVRTSCYRAALSPAANNPGT